MRRPAAPLTTTFVQSTVLNAIANLTAQWIDQFKHDKPLALNALALLQFVLYGILIVPVNFAWQRLIEARFPSAVASGVSWSSPWSLSSLWSRRRPAPNAALSSPPANNNNSVSISVHDYNDSQDSSKKTAKQTQDPKTPALRNFAAKLVLDLSVGGAMNILLFLVLINLLKGAGWAEIKDAVHQVSLSSIIKHRQQQQQQQQQQQAELCPIEQHFWPIMRARLKFRPVVSTLLYSVVPVDRRVVFGSACGVVWGIYLSLYAV